MLEQGEGIIGKRKKPDPAITDKWVAELTQLRDTVATSRAAVKAAEDALNTAVRAAFDEGVLSSPMTGATGLSSSRLFQIKHALRDEIDEVLEKDVRC